VRLQNKGNGLSPRPVRVSKGGSRRGRVLAQKKAVDLYWGSSFLGDGSNRDRRLFPNLGGKRGHGNRGEELSALSYERPAHGGSGGVVCA